MSEVDFDDEGTPGHLAEEEALRLADETLRLRRRARDHRRPVEPPLAAARLLGRLAAVSAMTDFPVDPDDDPDW